MLDTRQLGGIEVLKQVETTNKPDGFDEIWKEALTGFVGNKYTVVSVMANQVVRGLSYYVLAEQELVYKEPVRHIVIMRITKFGSEPAQITSIDTLF